MQRNTRETERGIATDQRDAADTLLEIIDDRGGSMPVERLMSLTPWSQETICSLIDMLVDAGLAGRRATQTTDVVYTRGSDTAPHTATVTAEYGSRVPAPERDSIDD